LPIYAARIDRFDAYLQLQALDAITFPNWSGEVPNSKRTRAQREGDEMRLAYRERLVQRATGGTQTTKKHIRATQLASVLQDYGFAV
jgi:hypothetical protein